MTCILNGVLVGYRDREGRPDAVRAGDLYECPVCKRRAVYGLAGTAHYAGEPSFAWEGVSVVVDRPSG